MESLPDHRKTLRLPDDLYRAVEIEAARLNQSINWYIIESLERRLGMPPEGASRRRSGFYRPYSGTRP